METYRHHNTSSVNLLCLFYCIIRIALQNSHRCYIQAYIHIYFTLVQHCPASCDSMTLIYYFRNLCGSQLDWWPENIILMYLLCLRMYSSKRLFPYLSKVRVIAQFITLLIHVADLNGACLYFSLFYHLCTYYNPPIW
jgi:hypothetical protein